MQQFDVVLKVLLRSSLDRITGNRIVRWLPTELPKVQNLRVDLLGETADGELVQIEVQSTNDGRVPFRMLEYLALIIRTHQRIPKQILLYVGREPLRMESQFTWADGHIQYKAIDMHAVDGGPFLTSPEPGDNVLAIVTRLQDSRAFEEHFKAATRGSERLLPGAIDSGRFARISQGGSRGDTKNVNYRSFRK